MLNSLYTFDYMTTLSSDKIRRGRTFVNALYCEQFVAARRTAFINSEAAEQNHLCMVSAVFKIAIKCQPLVHACL